MTRAAFLLCYVANVILAVVSLAILPERVAIHFGWGGMPDNWASNLTNTLFLLGLHTFLFLALYFSPRLAGAVPAKWVNLPNKEFWLAPENRARFLAKFTAFMHHFGAALFVFLFAVGLLSIRANLSEPVRLQERFLFVLLALFVAYTLAWVIVFFRGFRLPSPRNP